MQKQINTTLPNFVAEFEIKIGCFKVENTLWYFSGILLKIKTARKAVAMPLKNLTTQNFK